MGCKTRILKYKTSSSILPPEYQQLEYIQTAANGGSYIDTGVKAESGVDFEVDYKVMDRYGWSGVVGCRLASGTYRFWLIYQGNSQEVGLNGDHGSTISCEVATRRQHKLETSLTGWKSYFKKNDDWVLDTQGNDTTGSVNLGNLHIGAVYYTQEGNAQMQARSLVVYECKIWQTIDGVKTLVRHFMPCKEISTEVIGMYDVINEQFYGNNGTNPFISGGIVEKICYGLVGKKIGGHYLPAGYTELEYIESDGNSYIATGVSATNQSVQVQTTMKAENNSNWRKTLGYSTSTSGPPFSLWTQLNTYSGYGTPTIATTDITKFNSVTMSSSSVTFPEFYIFDVNPAVGSYTKTVGGVKTLTITVNGVKVRQLIPAKRNSDSEVGMYDKITNTFFTNSGTGSFTAGPTAIFKYENLCCIQTYTED